jgi:hypothetical protein
VKFSSDFALYTIELAEVVLKGNLPKAGCKKITQYLLNSCDEYYFVLGAVFIQNALCPFISGHYNKNN